MLDERALLTDTLSLRQSRLESLPETDFVAAWAALVGERPAAMLDSRSEMIRLLVESTLVAEATDGGAGRALPPPASDASVPMVSRPFVLPDPGSTPAKSA
jgi:hypothetical protein